MGNEFTSTFTSDSGSVEHITKEDKAERFLFEITSEAGMGFTAANGSKKGNCDEVTSREDRQRRGI